MVFREKVKGYLLDYQLTWLAEMTCVLGFWGSRMPTGNQAQSSGLLEGLVIPEGPCTQIVYTLAPMYLNREYFKANVCIIWVLGPLGNW